MPAILDPPTVTLDSSFDLIIKGPPTPVNNSANLFIGPLESSSYIYVYIRGANPPSGTSSAILNLSFPYISVMTGVLIDEGFTLFIKSVDIDSNINIYIEGPPIFSNEMNLFSLPRSIIETYGEDSPTLYLYGSYKDESNLNLNVSGGSPGNINLSLFGPIDLQSSSNLFMNSPTVDTTGTCTLVLFEYPKAEVPLFISGPKVSDNSTTLFTKYDLKYANSIDNAPSSSCSTYANTAPFDITNTYAESIVGQSNSISEDMYSTGTIFGYEPNQMSISDVNTDYKFYRYGRFQKVADCNGFVLSIGIREDDRPKLLLFSIANNEATFITKIDEYSSFIDGSHQFGECLVLDVKVSSAGLTAISSYIEVQNLSGVFTSGYFMVSIYDSSGNLIRSFFRFFMDSSNDAFMANHMGMTLHWLGETLLYTKEVGVVGTIQSRVGPDYDTETLYITSEDLPGYDETYNNWLSLNLPYYRMAFGHRISSIGSDVYVTVPLFCANGANVLTSYSSVKFNGMVASFSSQVFNSSYVLYDTIHSNYFFGYDLTDFSDSIDKKLYISSASDNSVWATDYTLASFVQNTSSDLSFGLSIDNCGAVCYTILDDKIYNVNTGLSFSYDNLDEEIDQYVPYGNIISSKQEKIKSSVIAGGYHFALREFDVTYGFGTRIIFNKLSLIVQSRQFDTPTLFMQSNGVMADTPLFLETIRILDTTTTLKVTGMYPGEDGAPLFIRQIGDGTMDNALTLKLKALDPESLSNDIGLNIYSTLTSDTFSLSNSLPLYFGVGDNSFSGTLPLKILGPDSANVESLINLSMNMIPESAEWTDSSSYVGISIINSQTAEANWQTKSKNSTLFLNSTYGVNNGLNLWMPRKGVGGGEEVESSANMTIMNKDIKDSVNLYTNAIYGITNNVSLVFLPSAGDKNEDVKIQIFGYQE